MPEVSHLRAYSAWNELNCAVVTNYSLSMYYGITASWCITGVAFAMLILVVARELAMHTKWKSGYQPPEDRSGHSVDDGDWRFEADAARIWHP